MTTDRYWLLVKAAILRVLMRFSMFLNGYPFPRPPCPTFTRTLPARRGTGASTCARRDAVQLLFYAPADYHHHRKHEHFRQRQAQTSCKYPVVVNFHGGGFCLGRASDDARWARTLVDITKAVVISVDYRRAPEHPFPAAVEDGVDTLLYLQAHSDELHLDTTRIALTGFSAGGNLAFTVPLRYHSLLETASNNSSCRTSNHSNNASDSDNGSDNNSDAALLSTLDNRLRSNGVYPPIHISAILSWYPILDFVLARDVRRQRSIVPSKTLPPFLTDLFDNGYLPKLADRESPFASPIHADDGLLAAALPRDIFMYMCEWDMLEHEGREFVERLEKCEHRASDLGNDEGAGREIGRKRVRSMLIEQCSHAWDKSANPFRDQSRVDVLYAAAGEELKVIFEAAGEV